MLLVQLGPGQARDDARLGYFLARVPPWIRVAVELRHPSWHHDEVFALLEQHGAAYCVMSGAGLPCILRATAPFVYVRLHGPSHDWLYAGSYSDDELSWWDVLGLAMMAGIGFTVSLLIGELAFGSGSDRDDHVKIAVLAGSVLAAALSGALLRVRNGSYRRLDRA